ncbi:UTRA domain-containing protein [Streptomyces sp. CA-294286]|uniref:UTRA domain-containing protein n=1 Tax=Streptomyces sp. CA-294286 TaxID=3240070 RepID=UPI003D90FF34
MKDRPPVRHRSSDRFRRSHRKGGKAAYLAESEQAGATAKVSVLFIGPADAPEEIAERLGVAPGAKVLARRRLYFRNGTPVETATSYLPWDVVKDIPELFSENPGPGGIYARLEDAGHEFAEFVETLQARSSSFGRKWRKARAAVGLPEGFRFYDLRHTGHTLATRSGATLKDTMVRAGQSSEKAAMIYQHSDTERQRVVAKKLDKTIRKARKKAARKPDDQSSGTYRARDT